MHKHKTNKPTATDHTLTLLFKIPTSCVLVIRIIRFLSTVRIIKSHPNPPTRSWLVALGPLAACEIEGVADSSSMPQHEEH